MDKLLTALAVIVILVSGYALSWCIVVGLIKLITMCFGFAINIKIATGTWLLIVLIKLIFSRKDK
jgi:hypothetical protein